MISTNAPALTPDLSGNLILAELTVFFILFWLTLSEEVRGHTGRGQLPKGSERHLRLYGRKGGIGAQGGSDQGQHGY
jgi:hypothetical protein